MTQETELLQDLDDASGLAEAKRAMGESTAQDVAAKARAFAREAIRRKSRHVLQSDRWTQRRATEITQKWQELEALPEGAKDPEVVTTDCHSALFDLEPQFAEEPEEQARAAWWKDLLETNEYQALHGQTCLNPDLTEIACKGIFDEWQEYAKTLEPPDSSNAKNRAPDSGPGEENESIADQMGRLKSVKQALQGATQEVDLACDMAAGLGMGEPGQHLDVQRLRAAFAKVRQNQRLLAIMQWAGRMVRMCQALQRNKVTHGADDMVGVELGGDFEKLIPTELMQLVSGVEELELLTLHRVLQRQAMQREYRGIEKVGKGPVVVCVDESGSMEGEKIEQAKGLAMALAWLARLQNRWCALVGFSGGTEGNRIFLTPRPKNHDAALIDWLLHFYNGGTTLEVPLQEVPFSYWPNFVASGMPRGKTDLVIITDGVVNCPDKIREKFLAWAREEQVTTYGLLIGNQGQEVLKRFCDQFWSVDDLGLDSKGVQGALSI